MLMGMQGGFTKYCCFLCLLVSWSTAEHYVKRDWQPRNAYTPGTSSVKFLPLVDPNKIYLPPLHIKLGLMKNLVKAMGKANSGGFQYLVKKFPSTSAGKLKEGIFIGPQIKSVLHDEEFKQSPSAEELEAWEAFVWLVENFWGNHKSPGYKEGVQNLLRSYQKFGCRISLKIHFLHSHLDFSPENLGMVSDEQGERFHKDIPLMERKYDGRLLLDAVADVAYTRKSYSKCF